jgi:hypothetical protein
VALYSILDALDHASFDTAYQTFLAEFNGYQELVGYLNQYWISKKETWSKAWRTI